MFALDKPIILRESANMMVMDPSYTGSGTTGGSGWRS
jgi:hypothetical protein